jgi:hypothetical protein
LEGVKVKVAVGVSVGVCVSVGVSDGVIVADGEAVAVGEASKCAILAGALHAEINNVNVVIRTNRGKRLLTRTGTM